MSDFPPNNAPYYQPLYGPTSNQPPNYPPPNQPPIQVNQPYNSSGTNASYRTPCNCIMGTIVVIFFLCGVGVFSMMFFIGISSGELGIIFSAFIPLIFAVVATVMGTVCSLYYSINVEAAFGTITIYKKKMCFCCNKKETIQVNELQQVIVQTDYSTNYEINGVHYNAFEIIFKLNDGREVKGCSGVIDKNGEGRRAFVVMRNALPQNIAFGGNLAY